MDTQTFETSLEMTGVAWVTMSVRTGGISHSCDVARRQGVGISVEKGVEV